MTSTIQPFTIQPRRSEFQGKTQSWEETRQHREWQTFPWKVYRLITQQCLEEDPYRPERNSKQSALKNCIPTETDTGTHYVIEGIIYHTNSNWSKLAPSVEDHVEEEDGHVLFWHAELQGKGATRQRQVHFHVCWYSSTSVTCSFRTGAKSSNRETEKNIIIWIVSKHFNPTKSKKLLTEWSVCVNGAGCLS